MRQESALSVPVLCVGHTSDVDYGQLLQALVGRLQDSSDDVIEAAEQAIYHLQTELRGAFKQYMGQLSAQVWPAVGMIHLLMAFRRGRIASCAWVGGGGTGGELWSPCRRQCLVVSVGH